MNDITDFLLKRRSTIIMRMAAEPVLADDLETILACGMRVPDHGVLAPWKFIVIHEAAAKRLGDEVLGPEFEKDNPDCDPEILAQEKARLLRAGTTIAVLYTPKEHPKIPQWEMMLSAGAATMNIVTAAQALGYATQWVTEWYSYNEAMITALGGTADHDKIAGFVYIGKKTQEPKERRRPLPETVIEYL